jgi:hypothetical protein
MVLLGLHLGRELSFAAPAVFGEAAIDFPSGPYYNPFYRFGGILQKTPRRVRSKPETCETI